MRLLPFLGRGFQRFRDISDRFLTFLAFMTFGVGCLGFGEVADISWKLLTFLGRLLTFQGDS